MSNKLLAEISRAFFYQKQIRRYKMKKIEQMSDDEVIMYCHHYCEDNRLMDEWNRFRAEMEGEYCYCPYRKAHIDPGECYDMQMVAFKMIKPSVLREAVPDRARLLECCKDCAHSL